MVLKSGTRTLKMASIDLGLVRMQFDTYESAEKAIIDFCWQKYHPIHVEVKEKIGSFNKKVKEESRITTLPDDSVNFHDR